MNNTMSSPSRATRSRQRSGHDEAMDTSETTGEKEAPKPMAESVDKDREAVDKDSEAVDKNTEAVDKDSEAVDKDTESVDKDTEGKENGEPSHKKDEETEESGGGEEKVKKEEEVEKPTKEKDPQLLLSSVKEIRKLIRDKEIVVEDKFENGGTWLHQAATLNASRVIPLLVEQGAGIDAEDDDGSTPLMCAVREGAKEAVKSLIKKGADVDYQDTKGDTALHIASLLGNNEMVVELLQAKADVALRNTRGETPLLCATTKFRREVGGVEKHDHTYLYFPPSSECVKILLDAGSDPNVRDYKGNTPLTKILDEPGHAGAVGFPYNVRDICAHILGTGLAHTDIPGERSERAIDLLASPSHPYLQVIRDDVREKHAPDRLECLAARLFSSMLLRSFGTAATMYVKSNIVQSLRLHMPMKCFNNIQAEGEEA